MCLNLGNGCKNCGTEQEMDTNTWIVWPYWSCFPRKWGQNLLARFLLFHPRKCFNSFFLAFLYPPPYPITLYWRNREYCARYANPLWILFNLYTGSYCLLHVSYLCTLSWWKDASLSFLCHHVWWSHLSPALLPASNVNVRVLIWVLLLFLHSLSLVRELPRKACKVTSLFAFRFHFPGLLWQQLGCDNSGMLWLLSTALRYFLFTSWHP